MKSIFVLLLLLAGLGRADAQVAVIAHPSVPATDIDANTLLDIYSLDKAKWGDGSRVVPFHFDGAGDAVYGHIGRSHADLKKVWLRKKLSGEGQPPEALASAAEVLSKVAGTPGAIGFVPAAAVTADVKVLATIGG